MASGVLKVKGNQVIDGRGMPIVLRGAGIGGWMNMENFITGFPGHEHQHRAAMLKVLGQEKYDYFFDKWLEYFFTDADAEYFASLGLNCIRIPFNYRHFEDDDNPRILKQSGFKHLDRVINLCARQGLYTILDMHAVPGGQNGDWHSDNPRSHAAFWDHKDFQDRTIWLWGQLAARYKCNSWVAGYNPLNEPCDPLHLRLPAFYDRVEAAIREVDTDHILWLDGNTFAMEWKGFDHVLPNCVYALHDYSLMGFPTGQKFLGTAEQKDKLEKQFIRKADFMTRHGTPIWNGEFGPVYADARVEEDAQENNNCRYDLLGAQLHIYGKYNIHWSIWLYKDIGVQGMIYTSPNSKWNKTIQPFLERKKEYQLDAWGRYHSEEAEAALKPLVTWIDKISPTAKETYPSVWNTERHVLREVYQTFLANSFSDKFACLFKDKDYKELDQLAHSFHFDECVQREGLNQILKSYAEPNERGMRVPKWQTVVEGGNDAMEDLGAL